MNLPTLESDRLLIRPFVMDDLEEIHRILDLDLGEGAALDERRQWLSWTIMSYRELARLYQPPYGDRAILLKETRRLIGACGLTPCLMPFGRLPFFQARGSDPVPPCHSPEVGLYWALDPAYQKRGYASEAARRLIDYAFKELQLGRIVATTTHDNAPSIGVMRRLGMTIETNPDGEPPYLQVVGILENQG